MLENYWMIEFVVKCTPLQETSGEWGSILDFKEIEINKV